MGAKETKLKEQFLFSIVANKEGDCANFLKVTFRASFTLVEIPRLCEYHSGWEHD